MAQGQRRPSLLAFLQEGVSLVPTPRRRLPRRSGRTLPPPVRVPVLLVPGLMAGDWTMRPMASVLRGQGHPTVHARIGINVGCTTELVDKLEERLEAMRREYGHPAAVVGWSRGGTLAKLVTLRRPDLVSALVALASPNVNPLAVNRVVELQLKLLNRLNAVGARRLLGADCITGECAAMVRSELQRDFPPQIPYIAFYSKSDGVVDWQACCDPAAELVEVHATHMQMGMSAPVVEHVARYLRAHTPRAAAATPR